VVGILAAVIISIPVMVKISKNSGAVRRIKLGTAAIFRGKIYSQKGGEYGRE